MRGSVGGTSETEGSSSLITERMLCAKLINGEQRYDKRLELRTTSNQPVANNAFAMPMTRTLRQTEGIQIRPPETLPHTMEAKPSGIEIRSESKHTGLNEE